MCRVCYVLVHEKLFRWVELYMYEGWNFNSGNYLFTIDTK